MSKTIESDMCDVSQYSKTRILNDEVEEGRSRNVKAVLRVGCAKIGRYPSMCPDPSVPGTLLKADNPRNYVR